MTKNDCYYLNYNVTTFDVAQRNHIKRFLQF